MKLTIGDVVSIGITYEDEDIATVVEINHVGIVVASLHIGRIVLTEAESDITFLAHSRAELQRKIALIQGQSIKKRNTNEEKEVVKSTSFMSRCLKTETGSSGSYYGLEKEPHSKFEWDLGTRSIVFRQDTGSRGVGESKRVSRNGKVYRRKSLASKAVSVKDIPHSLGYKKSGAHDQDDDGSPKKLNEKAKQRNLILPIISAMLNE